MWELIKRVFNYFSICLDDLSTRITLYRGGGGTSLPPLPHAACSGTEPQQLPSSFDYSVCTRTLLPKRDIKINRGAARDQINTQVPAAAEAVPVEHHYNIVVGGSPQLIDVGDYGTLHFHLSLRIQVRIANLPGERDVFMSCQASTTSVKVP